MLKQILLSAALVAGVATASFAANQPSSAAPALQHETSMSAQTASAATIDLNTATEAQLESLKGIGPSKAKAILDYRSKNGPFKTVQDLEKVPGFGPATVSHLASQLNVNSKNIAGAENAANAKGAATNAGPAQTPATNAMAPSSGSPSVAPANSMTPSKTDAMKK